MSLDRIASYWRKKTPKTLSRGSRCSFFHSLSAFAMSFAHSAHASSSTTQSCMYLRLELAMLGLKAATTWLGAPGEPMPIRLPCLAARLRVKRMLAVFDAPIVVELDTGYGLAHRSTEVTMSTTLGDGWRAFWEGGGW